jgi:hypothetical protein
VVGVSEMNQWWISGFAFGFGSGILLCTASRRLEEEAFLTREIRGTAMDNTQIQKIKLIWLLLGMGWGMIICSVLVVVQAWLDFPK